MAIPKKRFDKLFHQVSERYQENLLDYMEYLAQKSIKQVWDEIPEVDEPLTEEEKKQLANARTDDEVVSLEDVRRGLNL
jgi:hypothetical protein